MPTSRRTLAVLALACATTASLQARPATAAPARSVIAVRAGKTAQRAVRDLHARRSGRRVTVRYRLRRAGGVRLTASLPRGAGHGRREMRAARLTVAHAPGRQVDVLTLGRRALRSLASHPERRLRISIRFHATVLSDRSTDADGATGRRGAMHADLPPLVGASPPADPAPAAHGGGDGGAHAGGGGGGGGGSTTPQPRTTPQTMYVSPTGSDTADGLTPETAWQTLDRVNAEPLIPGDHVLLEGSATFDGTLHPTTSGTPANPIHFGTYGPTPARITGGIYLRSISNLEFEGLDVTNAGGDCMSTSGDGSGVVGAMFSDVALHDCAGDGLSSNNAKDRGISLDGSTIDTTSDTGVFSKGSQLSVTTSTIRRTGLAPTQASPRPAVYSRGPHTTVASNEIDDFDDSGVAIRFEDSTITDNVIDGVGRGLRGVSYYQESGAPGATVIRGNTIRGVRAQGIAVDRSASTAQFSGDPTVASTSESFSILDNTLVMAGDTAVFDVSAILTRKTPSMTIIGNRVSGTFSHVLSSYGSSDYREHDNSWATTPTTWAAFKWNGTNVYFDRTDVPSQSYVVLSGEGAGDQFA